MLLYGVYYFPLSLHLSSLPIALLNTIIIICMVNEDRLFHGRTKSCGGEGSRQQHSRNLAPSCSWAGPKTGKAGLHSFVCRMAPGRSARHHALNDLVARCFASTGTPVTKEPTGIVPHRRKEARQSDVLTTRPLRPGNFCRIFPRVKGKGKGITLI